MTIALQANNSANATSVTIGTHAAGDLIVIHASNHGSATLPVKPDSSWITSYSASAAGGSVLIAYKHAQSNSETSGTWSNSTNLFSTVWRGDSNTIVVPEFLSTQTGTTVNINYPIQVAGTLKTDASNIALLGYVLNSSATNTLLPPGALIDLQSATNGTTWQSKQYYQTSRTTSWANTTVTQATSAFYRSLMLSLIESIIYPVPSAGGLMLPSTFNGGYDG